MSEVVEVTDAPCYIGSAELMAQVVGFHLNRGVLATADRVRSRPAADLITRARQVAVLEPSRRCVAIRVPGAFRVISVDLCGAGLELHARAGRAVLVGYGDPPPDPQELPLPSGLCSALHEWAQVAEAVRRAGNCDQEPGAQVSQRGRLLAARLASGTGVPVSYADPMLGETELLTPGRAPEPTPWATGLPVSAATAVIVGVALLALSDGLDSVGFWLVALANLLVALGLAPSIWLARATPTWRWVAHGATAGILLTWLTLFLR